MARQLDCSSQQLLATTFHYLGEKFLCDRKQAIKLVGDSTANDLRYCPRCVEEKGYYQLTWRFQFIPGCVEHQCYLHDCCPHCAGQLPLMSVRLDMFVCPHCGGHIAHCNEQHLSPYDAHVSEVRVADMQYLIQPHTHTYRLPFAEKLARLRQLLGISLDEMARLRGCSRSVMFGFEHRPQTSILSIYMQYADYLGLSLREILAYREHDLSLSDHEVPQIRSLCDGIRQQRLNQVNAYEDRMLVEVKQAVEALRTEGKSDGQVAIGHRIGIQPSIMITHPRVKQYLEHVERERIERRVQSLSEAIPDAVAQLEAQQLPPSGNRIRELVGFDVVRYRLTNDTIDALLTPILNHASGYVQVRNHQTGVVTYQHIDEISIRLEEILVQAEQEGQYLKQIQIVRLVGVFPDTLRAHARTRNLLTEHEQRRIHHNLSEKLKAIEVAAEYLKVQKQKITAAAIGRLVGIRPGELMRYPALWERVTTLRQQDREHREADLLSRIQQAEQQLRAENRRVTLAALGRQTNMYPDTFKRYPAIFDYLYSLPEFKPN